MGDRFCKRGWLFAWAGIWPEVFVGEGPAGAGFQIRFEFESLVSVGEGDVGSEEPGTMGGCVGDSSFVVFGEAGLEVRGFADVAVGRGGFALEKVNVVHAFTVAEGYDGRIGDLD